MATFADRIDGYRRQLPVLARAGYRRLPTTAQRRLREARARQAARRPDHDPLLSVVMPVYNVENYLTDAVASALTQSYRNLELILVDDGSTDTSGAMCDDIAATDPRVRVIHKKNGGLGAARNTGIDAAVGEYIVFIDSDDLATPGAYQAMMSAITKSGSDLVTGNVQRLHGRRAYQAWNQSMSHQFDRRGITLVELPELLYDTVAWNKVFRLDFWRRHVKTFPVNKLYEDMLPMFTALINAESIDVIPSTVYQWRVREEGGSITQRLHEPGNLEDRLEMVDAIYGIIDERGLHDTLGERLLHKVLEGDLWIYVREMAGFEEDMEPRIQSAIQRFWTTAPPRARLQIPLERRVCYWLCERGRARESVLFREWHSSVWTNPPIQRAADGTMRLDVSECPVPLDGISDDVVDMGLATSLVSSVQRVRWTDSTTVSLEGYAYIRFVSDGDQDIRLIATNEASGRTVEFEVERGRNVQAAVGAQDSSHAHLCDGFVCRVDAAKLYAEGGADADQYWTFAVQVVDGPVVRTAPVDYIWRSGPAAIIGAATLADGTLAIAKTENGKPFAIRFERPNAPRADKLRLDGSQLTVTFPAGGNAPRYVWLSLANSSRTVSGRRRPGGAFVIDVPPASAATGEIWRLNAQVGQRAARVLPPIGFAPITEPSETGVRLETNRLGRVIARSYFRVAIADQLDITEEGDLDLRGALYALSDVEFGLAPEGAAPGEWHRASLDHGRFAARVRCSITDFDGVTRPLPAGRYEIFARRVGAPSRSAANPAGLPFQDPDFDPAAVELLLDESVIDRQPVIRLAPMVKVKTSRITRGRLRVDLAGPVPEEQLGKYNQAKFAVAAVADRRLENAVFYYVDLGFGACDSALALHHEIRSRQLPVTQYWAVDNLSVAVPEGGVPVLKRSPEWFEKLNNSRYLVNNYGGFEGLSKHPEQRYLQTWHGTPLKYIGVSEARHKRLTNSRFSVMAAEAAEWDAFISPSPYMSQLIPVEMMYPGRVLETGYPRNDRLAKAGDDERQEVRRRLGLPDSATVLLYAPTFREWHRNGWRAAMFEALDLTRLLSLLGPDWWVVLRGHSFNARDDHAARSSKRLIDATLHRDINDLYLVADALLTDYSSVMFDFAVTGKPMAFFTPDLEHYMASRGMYFDLEQGAPGPLYTDVASLAAGLADLPSLESRFRERYETFRHKFVPWDDGHAAGRVVDAFFT